MEVRTQKVTKTGGCEKPKAYEASSWGGKVILFYLAPARKALLKGVRIPSVGKNTE